MTGPQQTLGPATARRASHSVQRLVRPVAVLCVQRNSAYHGMDGVEAYDLERDARTFPGGMPVIAHPPCRSWSAHCSHQAKPEAGEQELGLWCVEQVIEWGGILEQPAHSRLWGTAGLPEPGQTTGRAFGNWLWSMEVWQAWWGYPMRKATWLMFSQIHPKDVRVPLRLHPRGCDRRREQLMSKNQRSATTLEFARWLVATARQVLPNTQA